MFTAPNFQPLDTKSLKPEGFRKKLETVTVIILGKLITCLPRNLHYT